jgi:hypothetical protein
MKALAQGKKQDVIISMIKHLINSTQGNQFETFLDEDVIKDIADVVTTDMELFNKDEMSMLNTSHAIQVQDDRDIEIDDDQSDNLSRQ